MPRRPPPWRPAAGLPRRGGPAPTRRRAGSRLFFFFPARRGCDLKPRRLRVAIPVARGPGIGRVREPPLCEIARQTLLGLRYLHAEKKIIHRDVKPSNILLNTDGSVKIGDFGVSGRLADSVAKCDSWVGTVTYMSPERISGEAYAFDSDVWSLGLSLLECATGRFPYALEEHEENGERSNGPKTLGFWDVLDHVWRVRKVANIQCVFPGNQAQPLRMRLHFGYHRECSHIVRADR